MGGCELSLPMVFAQIHSQNIVVRPGFIVRRGSKKFRWGDYKFERHIERIKYRF